jgi:hypothetical protein
MRETDDTRADFAAVFETELQEIAASRSVRQDWKRTAAPLGVDRHGLLGLALAGGGARGATFGLGVLEALAKLKLLDAFDYLSLVSGGGHIGAWLAAWSLRDGGIREVAGHMAGRDGPEEYDLAGWLRRFSQRLRLRFEPFTADFWAVAASWLGGTLLNLAIVSSAAAVVFTLPWIAVQIASRSGPGLLLALAGVLLAMVTVAAGLAQRALSTGEGAWSRLAARAQILLGALLLEAGFFLTASWAARIRTDPTPYAVRFGIGVFLGLLAVQVGGRFWYWFDSHRQFLPGRNARALVSVCLASALPAIGAGLTVLIAGPWLGRLAVEAGPGFPFGERVLVACGAPAFAALILAAAFLHFMLLGGDPPAANRDWWNGAASLALLSALAWMAVCGLSLFRLEGALAQTARGVPHIEAGLLTWFGSTVVSVLAGKSSRSGKGVAAGGFANLLRRGIILAAAGASLLGFLMVIAALVAANVLALGPYWLLCAASVLCTGLALRVKINPASLHDTLQQRLVQCYLGASHPVRTALGFTGFDPRDDFPLCWFANLRPPSWPPIGAYDGPYPIFNATVSLPAPASFVFTPRYCGYSWNGSYAYRPTEQYTQPDGVALGTALAASGAAFHPCWGYHPSRAVSFLLAVFNFRTGLWLGNPLQPYWRHSGPRLGLLYTLSELFGATSVRRSCLHVSDGAHFDGTGLYELVRRRCRFIVLCDGTEESPGFTFDALADAIRRCATDFGAAIDIPLARLRPRADARSASHVAVGRIQYDNGMRGTLVYLKPALTGEEEGGVVEFAARHPEFPLRAASGGVFDEPEFESYRKLGLHTGLAAFGAVASERRIEDREGFFDLLRQVWHPPARAGAAQVLHHAERLDELLERQRQSPCLAFLDRQFYPEWRTLEQQAGHGPAPPAGAPLPAARAELREGFYFCSSLIRFMESVYLDLDLEHDFDNPDHRGWMNLFRHWAWSGMFSATWAVVCSTCSPRFELFCHRRLALPAGEIAIAPVPLVTLAEIDRASSLNAYEKSVIAALLEATGLEKFEVRPVEMIIGAHQDPTERLRFPVGFTVTSGHQLVWLRIQDHLRHMGLGRAALTLMIEAGIITEVYAGIYGLLREGTPGPAAANEFFRQAARLAAERAQGPPPPPKAYGAGSAPAE